VARKKRQSQFDDFMLRLALWVVGVMFGAGLLMEFVSAQPGIAVAIVVVLVAAPIALWLRRRQVARQQAHQHIRQAQQLGDLLTVSGAEFELIVADLFRTLGYRDVERIGRSGDLGVDLTATDPAGHRVIVQCKRYGRGQKIGSPAIQALMGTVVNHGADRGIFVTTSTFTFPAVQAANSGRVRIDLIDGADLTQLATQAVNVGGIAANGSRLGTGS
jgi:restriction system protein